MSGFAGQGGVGNGLTGSIKSDISDHPRTNTSDSTSTAVEIDLITSKLPLNVI